MSFLDVLLKILILIGGLAFFLYGMDVMSSGLKKLAGGSLERSLKKVTSNPWAAMGLGTVITAVIQSSSAVTVMLVGLVNSGIMPFEQTIGVILGSNIGTTATAWLVTMSGIEGTGWLVLLKPSSFTPILATIGIVMIMMSKKPQRQDIGKILVGFAVLMFGLDLMGDAVAELKDTPAFQNMFLLFQNPILGLLVSTVFTGIIQSSSAAVGIIQTLSISGGLTIGTVIPLILGANIGTCVTALISCLGVNKDAKKVAVVHVVMKLIGAAVCMVVFYGLNAIIGFSFMDQQVDLVWIAAIHTAFNILNTAMLLPLNKQMIKITNRLVKDDHKKQDYTFLDDRLLNTASVAVSEAHNMTVKMAALAKEALAESMRLLDNFDPSQVAVIKKKEDELDKYEDKLGTFLVKLSAKSLSVVDSRKVSKMLHVIGNFERLGDHAMNVVGVAEEIHEKKVQFSSGAKHELEVLTKALMEILDITMDSFMEEDVEKASRVEPLEEVIDRLVASIRVAHIDRLQSGACTIKTGFVLADLLQNCERVSDHCSNIAVALIETSMGGFETHEYLSDVKDRDQKFKALYREYKEKYAL